MSVTMSAHRMLMQEIRTCRILRMSLIPRSTRIRTNGYSLMSGREHRRKYFKYLHGGLLLFRGLWAYLYPAVLPFDKEPPNNIITSQIVASVRKEGEYPRWRQVDGSAILETS